MPTLENDTLVFRFPDIEPEARVSIDFQRTLRIPDSKKTYGLPPGLGSFPLRHVEDYADRLPADTSSRGGVFMPMWQAEAMWLSFSNDGPDRDLPFPVAIKIAAGKVNAVSGEPWAKGLSRRPQDYVVSPEQPWLDGFAVEPGVIRQFVAMPLGEGYTAEEQLTGKAEWGGLQIMVIPLKASIWKERRAEFERQKQQERAARERWLKQMPQNGDSEPDPDDLVLSVACMGVSFSAVSMGLGAGGRMRQSVYPDPFGPDDWDLAAADRVFVSLIQAKDWKAITGTAPLTEPPSAAAYSAAGLPWFDYYGKDQDALGGGDNLQKLTSVGSMFAKKVGIPLPLSKDVDTGPTVPLGPGKHSRPVSSSAADLDN